MTLRLLFFSSLRDITGAAELDWQIQPGWTMAELLDDVETRWPALNDWRPSLLMAIDCCYVKADAALSEGAEVALMPPVQGG
jgi:molybdopterin synthase sulfur carrier subunit